jgi:DnaK suppressor protein
MAHALATTAIDDTAAERERYDELKAMLESRRLVLSEELNGRLRGVRDGATERPHDGRDFGEIADTDVQDEIQFTLLEMKAEILGKVNEALARLEDGRYGHCHECGDGIAAARLRALPFAVRCRDCEAEREMDAMRVQAATRRAVPMFDARS